MSDSQIVAPGWYPDPHAHGAMRWWDGHQWGPQHGAVQAQAQPATIAQGYAATYGGAHPGYAPTMQPLAGQHPSFVHQNKQSLIALGLAVAYLVLAVVVGVVLFGFIPGMYALRAWQSKEPLRIPAVLLSGLVIALGIFLIVG